MKKQFPAFVFSMAIIVGLVAAWPQTRQFVKAQWQSISDRFNSIVPIETKIRMARMSLEELDGEVEKAKDQLAREQVLARELRQKAQSMRSRIDAQKANLRELYSAIKSGSSTKCVSMKKDFAREFTDMEAMETQYLSHDRNATLAEERARLSHERLRTMQSKIKELTDELARLEVESLAVKNAETRGKGEPRSRLAEVQTQIAELKTELAVRRERTEIDARDATTPLRPKIDVEDALIRFEARQSE